MRNPDAYVPPEFVRRRIWRNRILLAVLALILLFLILRSCSSRPRAGSFSVFDYGAAGDGRTDDTDAIQRAIDAAGAAGGGVVSFPKADYLLAKTHQSTHGWFYYNLRITHDFVTLQGVPGARLLQGRTACSGSGQGGVGGCNAGRHRLVTGASDVRNTVLAIGQDYAAVRWQQPAANGGFSALAPVSAGSNQVVFAGPMRYAVSPGNWVGIYAATTGDVIQAEYARAVAVDASGVRLDRFLARAMKAPFLTQIDHLVLRDVAVRDLVIEGVEPLAITEAAGVRIEHCELVSTTDIGGDDKLFVPQLNTILEAQFLADTWRSTGLSYELEFAQRNSAYVTVRSNAFFITGWIQGEYANHVIVEDSAFTLAATAASQAGVVLAGYDMTFRGNKVESAGLERGTAVTDFLGVASYLPYIGQIKIIGNTIAVSAVADGVPALKIAGPDALVEGNDIAVRSRYAAALSLEGPGNFVARISANRITCPGSGGIGLLINSGGTVDNSVITGNQIMGTGCSEGIAIVSPGIKSGALSITGNIVGGFSVPLRIAHPNPATRIVGNPGIADR